MPSRAELLRELHTNTVHLWRCVKADKSAHGDFPFLTATHKEILFALKKRGEMAVKDIAETLEISGSAATQLVDTLVHKEVVTRLADADDRRIVRIRLSERASAFMDSMRRAHEEWIESLAADLSDEEVGTLASLLGKIGARAECIRKAI